MKKREEAEKVLIILINGKIDEILKKNQISSSNLVIKKIDEKDLSKFSFMRNLINDEKSKNIIFATYDLSFQRFTYFMKFYAFINGSKAEIIDQFKNQITFNSFSFLLIDTPKMIFELIYSSIILFIFKVKTIK